MKRPARVTESPAVYAAPPPGLTAETVRTVVRTIAERFKPARIVIFGSWARGGAGPTSDLDLLVIMKTNLPRYKRATPIRMLFDPTPCPMDILVFTPEEVERWNGTVNHIVTEALAEGVVAYEG